jgi:uncharacterized membrane protein YqiK
MTGADAIAIIILLTILVAVGVYLLHWLYRHSSKDEAFVRTGLGGEKVVMGGGASSYQSSTTSRVNEYCAA